MPIPWSRTVAAIEFVERTKHLFEFPDAVENALAEDYFQNPSLYTDAVLKVLMVLPLLDGSSWSVQDVLFQVRTASQILASQYPASSAVEISKSP